MTIRSSNFRTLPVVAVLVWRSKSREVCGGGYILLNQLKLNKGKYNIVAHDIGIRMGKEKIER